MATAVSNSVGLTGNPYIDGLVQGGSWQFGGGPRVITYSLSVNDTTDGAGNPLGGTWAQSPALHDAVDRAFSAWSSVANIAFQKVGIDGVYSQSPADIAVVLTGNELGDEITAVGIFPDPSYVDRAFGNRSAYPHPEGDIAIDNFDPEFASLQAGSRGFGILIHEIGHALGLKHPDDDGDNLRPTYAQLGLAGYQQLAYTVMLSDWPEFVNIGGGPVLLDVLAIQSIYGANTSFRTGDDTYGRQGIFQPRTIWDAGGIDTIDASTAPDNLHFSGTTIDLRPGSLATDGLSIAYGVVIENAVGTRGNDTIHGNDADNRLEGGLGADRMYGGKGNDTYIVLNGDEIFENPGEGIDTIVGAVGTLPANVENNLEVGATGRNYGNELDNIIAGSGERLSNDRLSLYGRGGNDQLIGTAYDDTLFGEAGNDVLTGGDGEDILVGGPGNDRLDGGPAVDGMRGGAGDDVYVVSNALPSTHVLFFSDPDVPSAEFAGIASVTTAASTTFNVNLGDYTQDGFIDSASFTLTAKVFGRNPIGLSDVQFITRQSGMDVRGHYVPGVAGDPNAPFLGMFPWYENVSASSFTVHEFVVDHSGASPILERLWISFERHFGSPDGPKIWGEVRYGSAETIWETVFELPNEGVDTVESAISYRLPDNVENLVLTESAHVTGMGNAAANVIAGNAGNNILVGFGGDDTLLGGAGYDTALFAGSSTQYAFVRYQGTLRVVDRVADRDGIDTLTDVEQARFGGDGVTAVFTASDVFTPLEYIASHGDLIDGFGANAQLGYEHFLASGRFALRTATFDGLEYLASQPDLIAGFGSDSDAAAAHYIHSGRAEGRSMSFNGLEYIASYADLVEAYGVNEDLGTEHYLTAGRFEGRAVTFRGLEYLASNPDLMAGYGVNFELATIHYISSGRFEGRTSSFHALEYIASYADLIQGIGANVNAGALHYINSGRFEGRTEHFDAAQYLANYGDLAAGFGGSHELAALHFIQQGHYEGRTDQAI